MILSNRVRRPVGSRRVGEYSHDGTGRCRGCGISHVTKLVASILVDDLETADHAAKQAFDAGADAVELRLDSFDGEAHAVREFLLERGDRTWIVTYRSGEEGGTFRGDTMERVSNLIAAARGTGAYVDFEWADWRRSDNIRQKVRLAAGGGDDRLVLSMHDLAGVPGDAGQAVEAILAVPGVRAAKLAYRCGTAAESFRALDLMRTYGDRVVAIAMGEAGAWTRVLAKKLGSWASFAASEETSPTAPGQLAVAQMVRQMRWPRIGPETKVLGVLGDPVAHSMSPLIFNRWFESEGIDAVYLPIRVPGGPEALRGFLDECRRRPWLDLAGFSVTIPHKRVLPEWAGDGCDRMVQGIGAGNTVVFDGDRIRVHNTDSYAAVGAIVDALGCRPTDLLGVHVDLLGAGGAARAVLDGLDCLGCRHTLYVRDPSKVALLAESYRCEVRPWSERHQRSGEIVINCTSLGMVPQVDESPLGEDAFDGCRLVFDLVYHPFQTRLLADARKANVRCLSGLDMFLRQAAMQFLLWFKRPADTDAAHRWIVEALGNHDHSGVSQNGRRADRHARERQDCRG